MSFRKSWWRTDHHTFFPSKPVPEWCPIMVLSSQIPSPLWNHSEEGVGQMRPKEEGLLLGQPLPETHFLSKESLAPSWLAACSFLGAAVHLRLCSSALRCKRCFKTHDLFFLPTLPGGIWSGWTPLPTSGTQICNSFQGLALDLESFLPSNKPQLIIHVHDFEQRGPKWSPWWWFTLGSPRRQLHVWQTSDSFYCPECDFLFTLKHAQNS